VCVCVVCARARVRACACARVALLSQHATRNHSHLWPLWLHHIFRHYLINGTIFGKKLNDTKCVLYFLYTFYVKHFLFSDEFTEIVIHVETSSCKLPVILVGFWYNLSFLSRFSKNAQISSFIKIRPMGAELFHAAGRTWRSQQWLFEILRKRLKHNGRHNLKYKGGSNLTGNICV
jgi:hypothetical protein